MLGRKTMEERNGEGKVHYIKVVYFVYVMI